MFEPTTPPAARSLVLRDEVAASNEFNTAMIFVAAYFFVSSDLVAALTPAAVTSTAAPTTVAPALTTVAPTETAASATATTAHPDSRDNCRQAAAKADNFAW